jgi:hypothetical protein
MCDRYNNDQDDNNNYRCTFNTIKQFAFQHNEELYCKYTRERLKNKELF